MFVVVIETKQGTFAGSVYGPFENGAMAEETAEKYNAAYAKTLYRAVVVETLGQQDF